MCGIAAAFHFGKRKTEIVNHIIMELYQNQYERGQEGFGFIKIGKAKEQVEIYRATEPVKATVDMYLNPTTMGILHHRSPTLTVNEIDQTHPIIVENDSLEYTYAVVHNGSITNAEELYKKHTEEQKFLYTTYYETHYPSKSAVRSEKAVGRFNDSESLAIELAKYIEGKTEKIESYGNAAFIVLQCTKQWVPVAIFFGRNEGKPLNMEFGESELYLSSTGVGDPIKTKVLYSAKINRTAFEIVERPLLIAEAPINIPSTYHRIHNRWSYCSENLCFEQKIHGQNFCSKHTKTPTETKRGSQTDPRPLCLKPNCRKVQRTEMNIRYCKAHKEMAKDDKANPMLKEIGKTWDCKELGGEMCYNCQHENSNNDALATEMQEKLPMGFRTPAEQKLLDSPSTEMKTNDDDDPTEGWPEEEISEGYTAQMMEAVMDEYFEKLEQEHLPDYNEYGAILEKLMEAEYEKVEKRLQEAGEAPIMWRAEVGPKIQEAEMYLAYLQDSANDKTIKEINERTLEERNEQTIEEQIETHQNTNYF